MEPALTVPDFLGHRPIELQVFRNQGLPYWGPYCDGNPTIWGLVSGSLLRVL